MTIIIKDFLSSSLYFRGLDEGEIDFLTHHAQLKKIEAGQMLWLQEDVVNLVYLPINGLVRISFQRIDGTVLTTALAQGSHVIGEAEVFAKANRRFNEACALIAFEVICISADAFKLSILKSPQLMDYWLVQSNIRFIAALKHTQMSSMRSAEDRLRELIKLLVELTPPNINNSVILPFSQETIAEMAALSRPAASKVIINWLKKGLIKTTYKCLIISNRDYFLR